MIKTLLTRVRQYKKASLLAPLFVTIEVVFEVLSPFIMASLIDDGIDAGNMQVIVRLGLLLLLCALLSMLCGALSGKYAAIASAGFATNLRQDLFYKVQEFSFSNIDRFSTAGIVTRLTTDVTNVQMAYMMIIRVAVRCPTMLIFAVIMAFNINADLAIIFIFIIPLLAILLAVIMTKAHPIFERVFKTYDHLNNVVEENLKGVRVVKSFVREKHEVSKFGRVSEAIYKDFSKAERLMAFSMPGMQAAIFGSMLFISWFGARLIVDSVMTTGQLMSLFSYIMQILISLMFLAMVFVMITISRASMERISQILNEKVDLTSPVNALHEVPDGSVRFENVDFSYSKDAERASLSGINLDIKSGQTVGIVGGTGASKTTLVQLIPRLYDVSCGTVSVGGHDVREYDLDALRNQVAMVLQKNLLFSGTISENLRWGNPDATDEQLEQACRQSQAHDFISKMPKGYDTYIEQGGVNVSGGQKQRLTIARALLKSPKIIILDDSTSAVDTATDALIRRNFKEQLPDVTKFIIAQRISSVQDADQIIVMEGGSINAVGTHEELLAKNPIYREMYESQQKGGDEDEA